MGGEYLDRQNLAVANRRTATQQTPSETPSPPRAAATGAMATSRIPVFYHRAAEKGDARFVRELLASQAPGPNDVDLREPLHGWCGECWPAPRVYTKQTRSALLLKLKARNLRADHHYHHARTTKQ